MFLALHTVVIAAAPADAGGRVPADVPIAQVFSCYNASVDWDALRDPVNDRILHSCISGATDKELAALKIPDLSDRIDKLQRGNLIVKKGERFVLAFPVMLGAVRAELAGRANKAADRLMPIAEKTLTSLEPLLHGRGEMRYHVLWSVLMDGPVTWQALKDELEKKLQKSVSLETNYLVYPEHQRRAGTNSDTAEGVYYRITWSPEYPMPNAVEAAISGNARALVDSAVKRAPVVGTEAKDALRKWGLIDDRGVSRAFVIDGSSADAQKMAEFGAEFAKEAFSAIDPVSAASALDVTAAQALVIEYHEVCYELLGRLSARGKVEMPKVDKAMPENEYQLVSFVLIPK